MFSQRNSYSHKWHTYKYHITYTKKLFFNPKGEQNKKPCGEKQATLDNTHTDKQATPDNTHTDKQE